MAGKFECSFSDKSCFPEVEFLVLFVLVLFAMCLRADRMAQLLDERDLGVLTSSMSLLVALVSNNHEAYWSCLPKCVKTLERLARNQDVPQEYTYYGIPSPWLQVKTMRVLQYFPTIEDPNTRRSLFEVLLSSRHFFFWSCFFDFIKT
jgi:hypothetical protein